MSKHYDICFISSIIQSYYTYYCKHLCLLIAEISRGPLVNGWMSII
jgi:hypothetical protein